MDTIDKDILQILQKNTTLPLSEIANRVGISKTPCWNRIRALEEKGVIREKVAILDNEKLNLNENIIRYITVKVKDFENEPSPLMKGDE